MGLGMLRAYDLYFALFRVIQSTRLCERHPSYRNCTQQSSASLSLSLSLSSLLMLLLATIFFSLFILLSCSVFALCVGWNDVNCYWGEGGSASVRYVDVVSLSFGHVDALRPRMVCISACERPSSPAFGIRRHSIALSCTASTRAQTAPCTRGSAAPLGASQSAPVGSYNHTVQHQHPIAAKNPLIIDKAYPSFFMSRQVSMGSALDCVWYMSLKPFSVRPFFSSHWK